MVQAVLAEVVGVTETKYLRSSSSAFLKIRKSSPRIGVRTCAHLTVKRTLHRIYSGYAPVLMREINSGHMKRTKSNCGDTKRNSEKAFTNRIFIPPNSDA